MTALLILEIRSIHRWWNQIKNQGLIRNVQSGPPLYVDPWFLLCLFFMIIYFICFCSWHWQKQKHKVLKNMRGINIQILTFLNSNYFQGEGAVGEENWKYFKDKFLQVERFKLSPLSCSLCFMTSWKYFGFAVCFWAALTF